MLEYDAYLMAKSLDEALNALVQGPDGARVVAGATDILPWAREGRAGDVTLPLAIDISRIDELKGFQISEGRVRLGAGLVLQRFLDDDVLRAHLPVMPYCAVWFADDQIREQATLVGNVVNASPAADGTPALLAMDAKVEIAGLKRGEIERRTVPLDEFVRGPGEVDLRHGEIVTAIDCADMKGYGGAFEKVGQRRSLVISAVCAACLVKPAADGQSFEDVRLTLAGIGPVPVRLLEVEDKLKDRAITRQNLTDAAMLSADPVASRTRRGYRREVVRGFIVRALEDAISDAGLPVPPAGREDAHA